MHCKRRAPALGKSVLRETPRMNYERNEINSVTGSGPRGQVEFLSKRFRLPGRAGPAFCFGVWVRLKYSLGHREGRYSNTSCVLLLSMAGAVWTNPQKISPVSGKDPTSRSKPRNNP